MLKILPAAIALLLAACSSTAFHTTSKPPAAKPAPIEADLTFQFDQKIRIRLNKDVDPALKTAFQHWVYQGVYTQAPVYRQLPGIFILTGKPRLAGNGFQLGTIPTPNPEGKHPEAKTGQVGLVTHADGTVGPELVIHYGRGITSCCESPANIRIGTIIDGRSTLKSVQRGDNLINIVIQP